MQSKAHIAFNKPFLTGKELQYIQEAVFSSKLSGDGDFTKKCHAFFESRYGFKKSLLTTSCTSALEMAAILCDIKTGDEVIVPSYTFVSTVNPFIMRGAKIVFADSGETNPNMDENLIEKLITKNTKAIIVVHYAGVANDMDKIMALAKKYNLFIVEDAAHSIDSFYKSPSRGLGQNIPLGSIGHFGTFSFHETKNVIAGEGGMLGINDERFISRAEIIREKGTNRSAFFRGEVDKYGWVDIGSSYLPSEIIAAFLFAQLENIELIQQKRLAIWHKYNTDLSVLQDKGFARLPIIPDYATNNAHLFYLVCNSLDERTALIDHLKSKEINAVFHYLSLHKSSFFKDKHDGRELPNADKYSDCLVRLPFYFQLEEPDQQRVIDEIKVFYNISGE